MDIRINPIQPDLDNTYLFLDLLLSLLTFFSDAITWSKQKITCTNFDAKKKILPFSRPKKMFPKESICQCLISHNLPTFQTNVLKYCVTLANTHIIDA